MNNSFVQQFSSNIKFQYFCFDRVIIRGYIRKFFFSAGVILALRAMGFKKHTSGVLRCLTDELNSHIQKEARKFNIPIHWWKSVDGGTDGAKLKYVQKKYANKFKGKGNYTFCILTDTEPTWTFASRELTSKKGKRFDRLYECKKQVKQYYIYFHDHVLGGTCYLKISSYLPFRSEFYFNGHNYIKQKLEQESIEFKMNDNAFVAIQDIERLQKISKELRGSVVQQRIDYWMNRFFRFDKGKYSTKSKYLPRHEWYMAQVEVSSNVIFRSSRFCTNLFERLLDKFQRVGLPDSIARVFSRRPDRRSNSKSFWRRYNTDACIKHWFRRNSVKQYNKLGYFIRTETTINNPRALGLKKPLAYLQAYLWSGVQGNDRFLNICADVDLASICEEEPELVNAPVTDRKGRRVAAPDLRKQRQQALYRELLKPKYHTNSFKTTDLIQNLAGSFRNLAQIRYEMRKLIARGLIRKVKNKALYRVTEKGWKWFWVAITSNSYFKNPIISKNFKKEAAQLAEQPSKIEEAYRLIDQGLSQITQELALIQ